MERQSLERLLDQGLSLAEIGRRFELHESTVAYWLKKHGLEAVRREKHAAKGGLSREQLEPLVEQGASIAEIAEALERSKGTVRHWLKEYGLKTHHAERRSTLDGVIDQEVIIRTCPRHGLTTFKRRTPSGYRCLKCRSEAVSERRRRVRSACCSASTATSRSRRESLRW